MALILYRLLKQVHQSAAFAMVVLVALGAGIACLNAVFEFEGIRVATGAVSLAVGAGGTNALALLLVDTQPYGLLIDTVFQGLWLMPLGYLAYESGLFPKALGVLLVVGACATWWMCSPSSWPPISDQGSPPSSSSRQQSRKSRWSYTCS